MVSLLPLLTATAGLQAPLLGAPAAAPPQTSHAWVTFDAAGVKAQGASGLADRVTGRGVTTGDPVRVASVSKLVTALGALRLAEKGVVDLDADVSRHLGWELRNPAHPRVPITLRMLLSHTSSVRDEGDNYVIPLGGTVRGMMARPQSFDRDHAPGTYFRYSNLNFPIVASVLEKAARERFDRLIEREVLTPLGLDACLNWSGCSDAAVARAVVLYRPDGTVARDDLGGRPPDCPVATSGPGCDLSDYVLGSNGALFSPQGGLRASPADLAVIGRMLLNRGRHDGRPFLSQHGVALLTEPVWVFNGSNGDTGDGFYCAYGLGTQSLPTPTPGCRDDLFGAGRRMVGHAGDAYNLRSGLWVDPVRKVGVAFYAANNPVEPAPGRSAYTAVEERLAGKMPR